MTDASEHIKGLAEVLQEIYDLKRPAGLRFCSIHTTLSMASAMNEVIRVLEAEMDLDKLVQNFIVDLNVDSESSGMAEQALDMCLKLVVPEYSAKPRSKYKELLMFLEEMGRRTSCSATRSAGSAAFPGLLQCCSVTGPTCVSSWHSTPASTTTWPVL